MLAQDNFWVSQNSSNNLTTTCQFVELADQGDSSTLKFDAWQNNNGLEKNVYRLDAWVNDRVGGPAEMPEGHGEVRRVGEVRGTSRTPKMESSDTRLRGMLPLVGGCGICLV